MPFFHFGPPPPHLLHGVAIVATGLLAGAAVTFALARSRFALACRGARSFRRTHSQSKPRANSAFEDYKAKTVRRLEEEAKEFSAYLARLKHAADRAEFEKFMTERRAHPTDAPTN
ncbi:MAG: DUF2852 domain-containing protein [Hyphomicrobiaceae bacterium]